MTYHCLAIYGAHEYRHTVEGTNNGEHADHAFQQWLYSERYLTKDAADFFGVSTKPFDVEFGKLLDLRTLKRDD